MGSPFVACSSSLKKRLFVEVAFAHETPPFVSRFGKKTEVSVLARNRTWSSTFAESRAIRHTPRTFEFFKAAHRGIEPRLAESKSAVRSSTLTSQNCQYPDLESNQDPNLRRVRCVPLHHRDTRADDWICTSMSRFTKAVPFYVEPRRQIRSRPDDRERFTSTSPIPRSSRLR